MKKIKEIFDNNMGNPIEQIHNLIKEIDDIRSGRLITHADGSVTEVK